jgi:hypothetical protein
MEQHPRWRVMAESMKWSASASGLLKFNGRLLALSLSCPRHTSDPFRPLALQDSGHSLRTLKSKKRPFVATQRYY